MKKILICPPMYFDIEYEINPWMHVEKKVDKPAAMACYQDLKSVYAKLPVELYEIAQAADLPDMVYMADCGHVEDNIFIAANFRYPERRRESQVASEWLQKQFGFEVKTLPEEVFFEGHGDLIITPTAYFLGWGKRTSYEAIPYLQNYLKKPIIDLELVDPYYYHLDTCFSAITSDVAVINPTSFTPEGLEKIYKHFKTVITASPEDHRILGCNLVVIDKNIIVAQGISRELRQPLESFGFTIYEIDTTEYRKGGGSVKCMTFEF